MPFGFELAHGPPLEDDPRRRPWPGKHLWILDGRLIFKCIGVQQGASVRPHVRAGSKNTKPTKTAPTTVAVAKNFSIFNDSLDAAHSMPESTVGPSPQDHRPLEPSDRVELVIANILEAHTPFVKNLSTMPM
jgi:hypothetical protein